MALTVPLMVGLHWGWYTSAPLVRGQEPIEVTITHGQTFEEVIAALRDAGLVGNLLYFKILASTKGADRKIRPGAYVIRPGTTPVQLLDQLTQSNQDAEVTLTVLEGWTLYHVADRVEALDLDSRDNFLARATAPDMLDRHKILGESVEGYLFPDTYRFAPRAGADVLLDRMIARHQEVWDELTRDVGPGKLQSLRDAHKLNSRQLLTLASIVEREAVVDDERPIIARVFFNRLQQGMRLQADPTCTYGPDLYKEKASPRLCKDRDSRYSTYVIDGLPPGPIANPGRASLRAVMAPTDKPNERDYLYFVARPDGRRHTFSKTYDDHRDAIPR
jgi:UPF0755 protein